MKKEQFRDLLPLVNDHDHFERLQHYAVNRIDILRNYLENTKEPIKIYEIQGAIAELRRFSTLRDEVTTNSKNG
jgi:predicted transcriptional regulator